MNNGIRIAGGPGEGVAVSAGPAPRGWPLRGLRWAVVAAGRAEYRGRVALCGLAGCLSLRTRMDGGRRSRSRRPGASGRADLRRTVVSVRAVHLSAALLLPVRRRDVDHRRGFSRPAAGRVGRFLGMHGSHLPAGPQGDRGQASWSGRGGVVRGHLRRLRPLVRRRSDRQPFSTICPRRRRDDSFWHRSPLGRGRRVAAGLWHADQAVDADLRRSVAALLPDLPTASVRADRGGLLRCIRDGGRLSPLAKRRLVDLLLVRVAADPSDQPLRPLSLLANRPVGQRLARPGDDRRVGDVAIPWLATVDRGRFLHGPGRRRIGDLLLFAAARRRLRQRAAAGVRRDRRAVRPGRGLTCRGLRAIRHRYRIGRSRPPWPWPSCCN